MMETILDQMTGVSKLQRKFIIVAVKESINKLSYLIKEIGILNS